MDSYVAIIFWAISLLATLRVGYLWGGLVGEECGRKEAMQEAHAAIAKYIRTRSAWDLAYAKRLTQYLPPRKDG